MPLSTFCAPCRILPPPRSCQKVGTISIPANHPFLGVEQDPHEGPIGGGDLTNQHSESGLALRLIVRFSLEGVEL